MGNSSVRHVAAVPDEQAPYDELYRAHFTRVVRLCRLLLADPHEAEDVAQEVFLKLFQTYQRQDRPIVWGAWLTRVAINACHDRWRSGWWKWWRGYRNELREADFPRDGLTPEEEGFSWKVSRGDLREADGSSRGLTPEEEVLGREECGRIWRSFRDLSPRQREVFVLRYLEGWSTAQVAKALGLTTGTVKRHLFRAVRDLRHAVGGRS